MPKKYLLQNEDVALTPEAVRAILAKESLIKASRPVSNTGNLITAFGGYYYVTTVAFTYRASDSAGGGFDEEDSLVTMLASEDVLRDEWDTPEEDEAWANLLKAKS